MALDKLLGLFADKMDYLTQRQGVIGSNISNANTPGYVPKDLESFDKILQNKMSAASVSGGSGASGSSGRMVVTNAKHLSGTAGNEGSFKSSKMKDLYEVKPDGNAVSVEQQMTMLAQTNSDYAMVTNLYKKMVMLMKTALGTKSG